MPRFELETLVRASPRRCFDLSRDVGAHRASMPRSGESVIEGRTEGLLELDEPITWRGRHFGLWLTHRAAITAWDPPHHFRDEMLRGHFRHFRHDHWFEPAEGGTRLRELVDYRAPWGPLGRAAEALFLTAYLRRLLAERAEWIRLTAERG